MAEAMESANLEKTEIDEIVLVIALTEPLSVAAHTCDYFETHSQPAQPIFFHG